jgi:hypothetical protein
VSEAYSLGSPGLNSDSSALVVLRQSGYVRLNPSLQLCLQNASRTLPISETSQKSIGQKFPELMSSLADSHAKMSASQEGLNDSTRTGLWSCYRDAIRTLRPRIVIAENVPGLLAPIQPGECAPISVVLGELSALGYDAEWTIVSARDVGAPHRRDRVFIVAYPLHNRDREQCTESTREARRIREIQDADVAHSNNRRYIHRQPKINT